MADVQVLIRASEGNWRETMKINGTRIMVGKRWNYYGPIKNGNLTYCSAYDDAANTDSNLFGM